ncbi:LysR family transcriptional regulator [Niallia taxi]|uniref:LysR family transcriptional regulator n=1 Tax=Niallia taxi TaxID=2499688 RepID=UPI0011A40D74|nr:LysR family transcriptional regulator [Niallia taxi]MDE5054537.1 LysR family transcriptional regulator [Niallia taxi]MED3965173.1 LysR family transcriptional regulator [Niallia taxi]WOD65965.1 LysR family transcriptional regulator [Niallia taxi]
MDKRDWQILQKLYKEKNITKVAESLFMSQPALTKRIQQIEAEYKVTIVHRSKKGIQFTPQGEYLVNYADEMIKRDIEVQDHLANMDDEISGTLRLGVSSFITRKIPPVLKEFKSRHPKVNFSLTSKWSSQIFNQVYNHEIHIGFVRGDYKWIGGKRLLLEENLSLVAHSKVDLEDLPSLPRIDYICDVKLQDMIDTWWSENFSVPPKVGIKVDKTDTCREMVAHDLGYAIMPSLVIKNTGNLYQLPLNDKDNNPITRHTWMFYNQDDYNLKLVKTFIEFMDEINFQDMISKQA